MSQELIDPVRDEVAWLIERDGANGRPEWVFNDGVFNFTPNPHRAIRFSRREDAEMICHIFEGEPGLKITEHMWLASRAVIKEGQ